MKVVIIILILIVIGFAVAIGVGVARAVHPPADDGSPKVDASGKVDMEALEDWKPPSLAAVMGKLGAPFAPKLLKRAVRISGQAGSDQQGATPGTLAVEPSKKDMRLAKLRLLAGSAALVTYQGCREDEEGGRTCPQVTCLCSLGMRFDPDDVDDCPEPWRKARTPEGGDRLECGAEDDDASTLIVYPEGGTIKIEPLAGDTATVQIR
jgi:hypothetical protein